MLTNYPFYFSSVRNLTAAFGTLFNNIRISRVDATGNVQSVIKVPLSYGPADKTITMLQQSNRLTENPEVKIVLPRASFELSSMSYDSSRKISSLQKNVVQSQTLSFNATTAVTVAANTITINSHNLNTGGSVLYKKGAGNLIGGLTDNTTYYVYVVNKNTIKLATSKTNAEANNTITFNSAGTGTATLTTPNLSSFSPIPYNFEYTLHLFVKYIDDGLQIIEQILPYFTPFYTITMNDFVSPDLKRDITITLTSVSQEDVYEGAIEEDRIIQWSLTFVANAWIYPPVTDSKIIKIADTNFFELDTTQKLVTTTVAVNPITADKQDTYTIDKTITEHQ